MLDGGVGGRAWRGRVVLAREQLFDGLGVVGIELHGRPITLAHSLGVGRWLKTKKKERFGHCLVGAPARTVRAVLARRELGPCSADAMAHLLLNAFGGAMCQALDVSVNVLAHRLDSMKEVRLQRLRRGGDGF